MIAIPPNRSFYHCGGSRDINCCRVCTQYAVHSSHSAFNGKRSSSTPERKSPRVNHVPVYISSLRAHHTTDLAVRSYHAEGFPDWMPPSLSLFEISETFKAHPHGIPYSSHTNAVNPEAHLNLLHWPLCARTGNHLTPRFRVHIGTALLKLDSGSVTHPSEPDS